MRVAVTILVTAILGVAGSQAAVGRQASVGNMTSHGGPLLHSPDVYVILWLPPGRHIEPSGDDLRVEARLQATIEDLGERTNSAS
jgi:hypothetical protein